MLPEGNVRIAFSKTGKIKYISHLDLCRTFKSAFIRAKFPLGYSEGFNPRPKMAFALTVSVGSESLCELLDIYITKPCEKQDLIDRLTAALTPDLKIKDIYTPTEKFTSLAYAGYTVTAETEFLQDELDRIAASPMIVKKHSKKGEIDADISPMIKRMTADRNKLCLVLDASQGSMLNPEYVMRAINAATDMRYDFYSILRTNIYRADMTEFT